MGQSTLIKTNIFDNFTKKKASSTRKESSFAKKSVALQFDKFHHSPLRYVGFSNELGVSLAPLIGPVGEMLFYAPALTYMAMDIKDKALDNHV